MPNLTVKTPTIFWVSSKKLEPPSDLPGEVTEDGVATTILGRSNYRGAEMIFGIKPDDRRRHIYIIGKTGMGKSTVLENMIYSDIMSGKGVGVIDPHGDLAESVLSFIPPNRTNDVVLIDPSDKDYAVAFNMLENVDPALNSIVCSGLVGIFKKIYAESWGPRLEHILRNTILALLEYPGTTMLGITRILQDAEFRRKVIRKIEDPVVKSFWLDEFEKMQDRIRVEAISPILNKVGQFLSSSMIRNIVGQPKSTVDLKFFMDKGKIVIINLSKGKIGEDNSALLGSMFVTKFQLDAMSRANIPEKERKDFYLYVDEFQNFATEAFATILSEARKYKLNLTMANQYIAQMPDEVRDAVFGNVGTIFSFQVGFDDAEYLSQQYGEEVLPPDLVSLSKYTAYMRLLVDGMPTSTFSLATLPPPVFEPDAEQVAKVVKVSRQRYAKNTSEITDKIKKWSASSRDRVGDDGEKKDYKKAPFKKPVAKK
ncbi:type IV secretory system conjugative DNA transfer family protein [Patescibacteria group bacterium]|nr:type IV secretory system conjugative DNA transfer family protein [Patescibacteria group bacterium]